MDVNDLTQKVDIMQKGILSTIDRENAVIKESQNQTEIIRKKNLYVEQLEENLKREICLKDRKQIQLDESIKLVQRLQSQLANLLTKISISNSPLMQQSIRGSIANVFSGTASLSSSPPISTTSTLRGTSSFHMSF